MAKVEPLSDAERQRRRRARIGRNEMLVSIPADQAITAKLHAGGYLAEHELESKAAIAEAIVAVLHDFKP